MVNALWGMVGVFATGVIGIMTEQIRNNRKIDRLRDDIDDLKTNLQDAKESVTRHINWHLRIDGR